MHEPIRIALLGNVTTEYLGNALAEECRRYGLPAEVYNTPFRQYTQEALNPGSGFYSFSPRITLLFLEGRFLFPDWYDAVTLQRPAADKEALIEQVWAGIADVLDKIRSNSPTYLLVNNFKVPYHSPLGILDTKQAPGLKAMLARLNGKLEDYAATLENIGIFDYNGFSAYIGHRHAEDSRMYYLSGNILPFPFLKQLAHEYMRFLLALSSRNKKCLVLDLDNTLWGGVAGEEGISGIKLDIHGPGKSYHDFQKSILNLYNRGILLAINSKNNPEDALEIMEKHPYMLLRKSHFASLQINWKDKASNMIEIAKELNIGLDSLVFFDDSPVERELVRSLLPQITVVDVPVDSSRYCDTLSQVVGFESLDLTEEDIRRNQMYEQNKEREEVQQQFTTREQYLASLQTVMTVKEADKFTLPRVAQLTQKTNQFNMTTRRYQPGDLGHMLASGSCRVYCCSVSDRFGDNGVVGSCIIKIQDHIAHIDTFLLSCRVLGRNVEFAFLQAIVRLLREKGIETIFGEYIRTEKNRANSGFYRQAGFTAVTSGPEQALYVLDAVTVPTGGEFIDIRMIGEGTDIG